MSLAFQVNVSSGSDYTTEPPRSEKMEFLSFLKRLTSFIFFVGKTIRVESQERGNFSAKFYVCVSKFSVQQRTKDIKSVKCSVFRID